jgi:hypothetical protein
MVRGHYDKYDDNSSEAFRCRTVAAAGISILGLGRRAAACGRRSPPSLPVNRKEDSPLFAPRPSRRRALLWPAGVCALHFSSTKDDVAKNAPLKPCHVR